MAEKKEVKEPKTKKLADAVAATIDPASRTFTVTVDIEDPHGRLRPGMYAEVELVLERVADAMLVPPSAVLDRGELPGPLAEPFDDGVGELLGADLEVDAAGRGADLLDREVPAATEVALAEVDDEVGAASVALGGERPHRLELGDPAGPRRGDHGRDQQARQRPHEGGAVAGMAEVA